LALYSGYPSDWLRRVQPDFDSNGPVALRLSLRSSIAGHLRSGEAMIAKVIWILTAAIGAGPDRFLTRLALDYLAMAITDVGDSTENVDILTVL
jgi:hypothetical protein